MGTKIEATCGFLLLEDNRIEQDHTSVGWHGFHGVDSQQGRTIVWTFGHDFLGKDLLNLELLLSSFQFTRQ